MRRSDSGRNSIGGNGPRKVIRKTGGTRSFGRDSVRKISTRAPGQKQRVNKRKLIVSNLALNIKNSEIYDLFSRFGPMHLCKIKMDNFGRSTGTAIVEYKDEAHAAQAVSEYDGLSSINIRG